MGKATAFMLLLAHDINVANKRMGIKKARRMSEPLTGARRYEQS